MTTIARRIATFSQAGPEARAWALAVAANGGSVTLARLVIVSAFIAAEKASGAWALTDDYWGFWGENSVQALTSLKQRRLAVAVNSPTFVMDRHFATDGVSSYIDLVFNPTSHGVAYTASNQRIAVYSRVNATSTGQSAGASDGSSGSFAKITINPRNGNNMTALLNTATASPATFALGTINSQGLKAASRAGGGTTGLAYDRGVRLTDVTGMTVAGTRVNRPLYAGCYNNAGTAAGFRSASIGFLAIGAPLSDAQELAQNNAVQAWATSVGANV